MLEKLTEGIRERSLSREGEALVGKWEQTGLLEGLETEVHRNNMARLLENQAAQLLKEASTMSAGDVEGFASVAFPIVRRVFGGLLAQDLVSVQPMSLPSGLIFFMDFTHNAARLGAAADDSLYGGGRVGRAVTGGLDLSGANAEKSFYNLNNGYASPTGSATVSLTVVASGTVGGFQGDTLQTAASVGNSEREFSVNELCKFDPDLSGSAVVIVTTPGAAAYAQLNRNNLITFKTDTAAGDAFGATAGTGKYRQIRRLTTAVGATSALKNAKLQELSLTSSDTSLVLVYELLNETISASGTNAAATAAGGSSGQTFAIDDKFASAGDPSGLGAIAGSTLWDLEAEPNIPEIDIKVDSIAITAMTKKLKAKWSPELAQDLNAYHNLDAEVELTSILSEQIALEIDQEILNDLVQGATEGPLYWSRRPGKFVDIESGVAITVSNGAPDFTGTVSEWYETLLETINDLSARIHRKTLRGGANFLVCSPEVAAILEFTSGFRASTSADEDRGSWGAMQVGSLSKKMDIYVDPYFMRNVLLVGRKGNSFLESGYVYAPYVPLQVTPTIFGTEDFVPRKGVMTRYGKKMVQPAHYGIVICQDLIGQ